MFELSLKHFDPILCVGSLPQLPTVAWSSMKVLFANFFFQEKVGGGPKWTRTTDLTIISRVL